MFKFIKKLLHRPTLEELANTPNSGIIIDKDFGMISYEPPNKHYDEGYWQMYNSWTLPAYNADVSCSAIPGDLNGPFEESRYFLLSKKDTLNTLWELCNKELHLIKQDWYPNDKDQNIQDIYYLSSFGMGKLNTNNWDVSFEAKENYRWTFVTFEFKNNTIINNIIDT